MVLDSHRKAIFLPSRQGCRTEDEEEKLHREKGKRKNIIEKLTGKKRPHGHFLSVVTRCPGRSLAEVGMYLLTQAIRSWKMSLGKRGCSRPRK